MKFSNFLTFALILLVAMSCNRVKTPDAVEERNAWINSFTDSVAFYKDKSEKIESSLQALNAKVGILLEDFEMVRNPREVSGYYIMKGWNSKLPLINTGIYARINENEKLELIATLGGNTFNQIAVGDCYSDVVRHDQAFNYRHERFNTVYFSGGKADSIAEYVYQHETNNLKLEYLEGKRKYLASLSRNEIENISKTWQLYNAQKETHKLQKELLICSRKIDTFRRFMNEK